MKNLLLLLILLISSVDISFAQNKLKANVDVMAFLGRVPHKSKSNSLADNLLRILYYKAPLANQLKIGYLNIQGEVVIKPTYNLGSDFYGNYANIISDSGYGYIDKEQNEVFFKDYNEVFFYYGDTGIAKQNGMYGLINRKGHPLTDFQYKSIRCYGFSHFKCQTENKRSHILNSDGEIIFNSDLKFERISSQYFDTDSLIIFQEKIDGKKLHGLVKIDGEILFEPKYHDICEINDDDFYSVKKDGKHGFINKIGVEVIPLIYDDVGCDIKGNLIPVQKNGKWGFINRKNEVMIPFEYEYAYNFYDGLAFVKKGDFYGCINPKNKTKVKFKLEMTKFPFFTEQLAIFKKEGKYGFINKKGRVKIPAVYENASPFVNGLAYVELNGKAGYINKKGIPIIPIEYKQLWWASEKLIRFAE